MHLDEKGFLVERLLAPDREVKLVFAETTWKTIDQQMVVYQKGKLMTIRSAEIGDGIELLRFFQRPFVTFELSPDWLIRGMSGYRDFDEQTGAWIVYLYGFGRDEEKVAHYQDYLYRLGLPVEITTRGRYIQLEGADQYAYDMERLRVELTRASIGEVFSWMFGMVLTYGIVRQDETTIYQAQIHLPLVGSLVDLLPTLESVIDRLTDHGIFVQMQRSSQKIGEAIDLIIQDWEFLYHISKRGEAFGGEDKLVASYDKMHRLQEQLAAYLSLTSISNADRERVSYSVLKRLQK